MSKRKFFENALPIVKDVPAIELQASSESKVQYPDIAPKVDEPPVIVPTPPPNLVNIEQLYIHLLKKTAKLDEFGLIVFPIKSLISLIQALLKVDNILVQIIHYSEPVDPPEVDCFGNVKSSSSSGRQCPKSSKNMVTSLNKMNKIHDIKIINGVDIKDFKVAFNDVYNRIRDEYQVSLDYIHTYY